MSHLNELALAILLLTTASCVSVTQNAPSYPNPPDTKTAEPDAIYSSTAAITTPTSIYSPLLSTGIPITIYPGMIISSTPYVSPTATESLFTPTPDPNALSITAEIEPGKTREEITRILFSEWLDHYLSEDISVEMRLSEYSINSVLIPKDQSCATKLGAGFIAEAEVTAKTAMPVRVPIGQYSSRWMVAAGGIISESDTHRTIRFISAIYQVKNEYTLKLIMQAPLC